MCPPSRLVHPHRYYGDRLKVECPTGSGRELNLREVAIEIAIRLASTFTEDGNGRRLRILTGVSRTAIMDQPEPRPATVVSYEPVGVVRSPYTDLANMPLQSVAAQDIQGQIEVRDRFVPGLADLDGFSHLHIVTHLHRGAPGELTVVPFLDDAPRGIFATRSPRHPNPIGLSVVRLLTVEGNTLQISGIDLLDGTPVLDIKPYVPEFDAIAAERTGWLQHVAVRAHEVRSDARFEGP